MMDKNIDESWKEAIEKEKQKEPEQKSDQKTDALEFNFNTFISSIAMEALIFLGELPNPVTKKKEENLTQARYVIDIISMLKDKTKGNLTAEEANNLDNVLYELRSRFITKNK